MVAGRGAAGSPLRGSLARGGAVVEPIHPGRMKEVVSQPGFKDVGYWGYCEYSPEAFHHLIPPRHPRSNL